MSIYLTIFLYVLFGFLAGIFGGLGMGGGTLLIPLLTIFLGLNQKLCQGINLLSFLVMALFSLIIHYKNGYIQTRGIFYMILTGVLFSIAGAFIAVNAPTKVLRITFGVFLCILSIFEAIKAFPFCIQGVIFAQSKSSFWKIVNPVFTSLYGLIS